MRAFGRLRAAAVGAAAVLAAAGAFAQDADVANVPFKVNADATVTARRGAASHSIDVTKDVEKTLTIPLGGVSVSYWGGVRGRSAPVITASRGKVTLNLSSQSYKSADIAVYSVNGRQILRGRAAASEAATGISRRGVAAGVYVLSVRGVNGGAASTARLTHSGGNMDIIAAFGAENASSPGHRLGKSAAVESWDITVSAAGYKDSAYALSVNSGNDNALQNITLAALANVVAVTFNGGGAPTVSKPADFGNDAVKITGGHVVLDMPSSPTVYNVTVSGTTANGSIKIYNRYALALHLDGANITNPKGPAVNLQNPGGSSPRPITVNVSGSNKLADGATYDLTGLPDGEQAKGTFFSERRVTFSGGGLLEVSSMGGHAIVVDNDLTFNYANVKITGAEKDGIHANDSITINGGTFEIKSKGEAIQNENSAKAVLISGAKITANTTDAKSHGISGEGNIVISGNADIELSVIGNGSKGIRSRGNMLINGGDIYVNASGDRDIDDTVSPKDTSTAAGIKVEGDMVVTGGKLELISIKSGGNGKGINVNGKLTISGGEITARADGDGIKVHGDLVITGGKTYARSARTQDVDVSGTHSVDDPSMLDGNIGGRKQ